jgi:hypothetical protein
MNWWIDSWAGILRNWVTLAVYARQPNYSWTTKTTDRNDEFGDARVCEYRIHLYCPCLVLYVVTVSRIDVYRSGARCGFHPPVVVSALALYYFGGCVWYCNKSLLITVERFFMPFRTNFQASAVWYRRHNMCIYRVPITAIPIWMSEQNIEAF